MMPLCRSCAAGLGAAGLGLLAAGWVFTAGALAARTAAAASESVAPAQAFSVQDLVRMDRISEVAVSGDGRRVAYTMRATDMAENRGRTAIWILELHKHNAAPMRLTDLAANSSSPSWSPDGRYVYYLSNRTGTSEVWRSDVRDPVPGDGAQQVTRLPLDVGSFRLSPTSAQIIVSMEVFIDCPDIACTVQRLDANGKGAGHGVLYDKLFVRHWDTWSDGRRSQLFALPLDAPSGLTTGTAVKLTEGIDGDVPGKPFGGREDYAVSPDGTHLVFSARTPAAGEPWSTRFNLYEVAVAGGKPRNLTPDDPVWDARPAYSPDGSELAYVATDRPGYESDRFHLVLLNLKTGVKRPLTESWDRSIDAFAWAPDGRSLFATTDHLGQHPLWAIDAKSGRAAAITGDGDVEGFDVGKHKVFYIQSTLASPADLYEVGFFGGSPTGLTHLNQELLAHRRLGAYEQFSFAGWNSETVYGYWVKPVDFKRDQKYPVALVIHGGPHGSMANNWHWRWNAQALAGAGYAVLLIDFHGSTGYGQAFSDSIAHDWGGKPLEDLKLGVDAVLKRNPWMDGARMCALGGSYGGYMVNLIAGSWPDRFKCLVTHDGVFDNRSMYYSTDELWFPEWEMGGPEFSDQAAYAKFNPVDAVDRWKTPTLVIHGQLDFRVPDTQGIAVFTALQRRAIPSELLYFPDENHWVLKPENSIQWYRTVIAWLNRWTAP